MIILYPSILFSELQKRFWMCLTYSNKLQADRYMVKDIYGCVWHLFRPNPPWGIVSSVLLPAQTHGVSVKEEFPSPWSSMLWQSHLSAPIPVPVGCPWELGEGGAGLLPLHCFSEGWADSRLLSNYERACLWGGKQLYSSFQKGELGFVFLTCTGKQMLLFLHYQMTE